MVTERQLRAYCQGLEQLRWTHITCRTISITKDSLYYTYSQWFSSAKWKQQNFHRHQIALFYISAASFTLLFTIFIPLDWFCFHCTLLKYIYHLLNTILKKKTNHSPNWDNYIKFCTFYFHSHIFKQKQS